MFEALKASGASRVLDLGCGGGKLLRRLRADHQFAEIVGMDVSGRVLDLAESRLKLERLAPKQRERIRLLHGSLMYRDPRLAGFDAASVVEVIEHLDQPRLRAFERVLFESARPATIALTTPNAEYNVKWPSLPAGQFRHQDHRFEWTRAEFQGWANDVASRFGYAVTHRPVGDDRMAWLVPGVRVRSRSEGDRQGAQSRWDRRTVRRNVESQHDSRERDTRHRILNNELYVGRLIWNRLRNVKNPDNGKRISRLNPQAEWIAKENPALRIVSDELWNAAKDRQRATRRTIRRAGNIGFARRPQYLFSGLSKCGVCGAGQDLPRQLARACAS